MRRTWPESPDAVFRYEGSGTGKGKNTSVTAGSVPGRESKLMFSAVMDEGYHWKPSVPVRTAPCGPYQLLISSENKWKVTVGAGREIVLDFKAVLWAEKCVGNSFRAKKPSKLAFECSAEFVE